MNRPAVYPDLEDRVVVITGGATGIGAELVQAFCDQGSHVGFLDIDATAGRALVEKIGSRVVFEPCDVRDIEALRAGLARISSSLGPARILVNNAASDERHGWSEISPETWDERFAVNLRHQFFAAQALAREMEAAGGGSIVNLGSTSWRMALGHMVAYTTAKAGVEGLTRSLAREFGPLGIRVNAVIPGWVFTERQLARWVTPEAEMATLARQCVTRRLMPADIAAMVLFLGSEAGAGCTAQSFVVDLGLT